MLQEKRMVKVRLALLLAVLFLSSCATTTTSAVMFESGESYPPTKNVQILIQEPIQPFKQIALLEARGMLNTPIPDLLESMRKKAAAIGADAVIPIQYESTQQQQGIMYNPWLGGYQTIGGGTLPVIRGIAIKYTD